MHEIKCDVISLNEAATNDWPFYQKVITVFLLKAGNMAPNICIALY
jgi:hypothetical protein